MKIDVVIPSIGRIQKLTNTLNSILKSAVTIPINLYVYFSLQSEREYFGQYFQNMPEVHLELLPEYRVPDFWNMHLNKSNADMMVYLNDDILLEEDTLKTIIEEFPKMFPDFDGVMGLRQTNLPVDQALEGAFGVIGKNYKNRFPNGQVWCLDYQRFYADRELWLYAKSIGKFHFCSIARITHLHPVTDRTLEDKTHVDVRKYLPFDREIWTKRQANNWLWGRDFNLVNK